MPLRTGAPFFLSKDGPTDRRQLETTLLCATPIRFLFFGDTRAPSQTQRKNTAVTILGPKKTQIKAASAM